MGMPRAGLAPPPNFNQPNHCVWIGGFPRKLVSTILDKAAKAIILAYTITDTDVKIISRSMQPGFKFAFEDQDDMKDFLQSFRATPHVWTDPSDQSITVTLHAKVDRSAADRVRISLMTIFWGHLNPILTASDQWKSDRNRLRSQGTSGVLWVDNSLNDDGRELLSVRFGGTADPTIVWSVEQSGKFNILPAKLAEITDKALAEWKAKHAGQ